MNNPAPESPLAMTSVELGDTLVRVRAVSYTHLDVYKRQIIIRANIGRRLWFLMLISLIQQCGFDIWA